ncbi:MULTISPECIES: winged helix-turn-helix domain-containing protein [unclassified Haloferax]|jgi:DNA-binding transcriptional ArsR family regulator|uniref:ArsR/SmtB family transcription factor n=1 Tax=unclassified Haloferax TaxID=2625095 RepID=UPI002875B836|nr:MULTISPECIES: winged helix-turn-helix domain-containing protein [unclassified Haloferax]MDS0243178.1 winged helix-turn-helix domain-containing protein [Haloferax sp. S2CR25]MDS0446299.1 winged helix-turn-helix domain-containing protein [Haloferax sp. S2CR25-2]
MRDEDSSNFAPPITRELRFPVRIAILGILAEASDPLRQKEILKQSGISRPAFVSHRDQLQELDLIEVVKEGGTTTYQLADSEGAEAFKTLNKYLGERVAESGELETRVSDLLK